MTTTTDTAHAAPSGGPTDAQILASLGQAVIATDPLGTVTRWNAAAERLYGWSAEEASGRSVADLTVPDVSRQDAEEVYRAVRRGEPWSGSLTMRHRDGSTFRALVTATGVRDSAGSVVGLVGVSSRLGEAVRPLLEASSDAATVVGLDGRIRFASPAVTNVFGWSADVLTGQPALSLVHPDDAPLLERVLRQSTNGSSGSPLELRVRARDGSWRWAEAAVSDLKDDPAVRGVVLHMRDVTDRRAAHERLTRLALHDPLTGLPNRSLLYDRIRHAHARRGSSGALMLVDLDDFKAVNRRHGHAVGDELMRTLAVRLDSFLRVEDTCGRLGGDELVVLAEGVRGSQDALDLAERLQASLARPVRAGGAQIVQTASIGVTLLAGRRRGHELLRECVAAVYDAKQDGPGRIALFDSIGSDGETAGGLVRRLRRGLTEGEIVVHYQPVLDLRTRLVVGVEALVRWQHPRHGLLPADAFVDAAENDDLIYDLGAFVLHEACARVQAWPGPELDISVNVSARQLADSSLLEVVQAELAASGLAPQRLVLEITETALMQDLAVALEVLSSCRALGVRISLDDFGTGFAGFGYLRELPVDEVKIDRSFVSGLGSGGADASIIRAIISMSSGLGLRTTGEGVETVEQARILTELGCDRAQGYLWSPAVPEGATAPTAGRAADLVPPAGSSA